VSTRALLYRDRNYYQCSIQSFISDSEIDEAMVTFAFIYAAQASRYEVEPTKIKPHCYISNCQRFLLVLIRAG
jgi:hypothetical protein